MEAATTSPSSSTVQDGEGGECLPYKFYSGLCRLNNLHLQIICNYCLSHVGAAAAQFSTQAYLCFLSWLLWYFPLHWQAHCLSWKPFSQSQVFPSFYITRVSVGFLCRVSTCFPLACPAEIFEIQKSRSKTVATMCLKNICETHKTASLDSLIWQEILYGEKMVLFRTMFSDPNH